MPQLSPLRFYLAAAAAILSAVAVASSHHTCSPPYSSLHHPCPPFRSPPSSFPFSSSPGGCGHPSFQIHCSSPHSNLSINSIPFLLLSHHPPNSLILTPSLPSSLCPGLPSRPINLSSSPFRLSPDPCPLLSSIPPSNSTSSSKCRLSPFQSRLLSNPLLLLSSCSSSSSSSSFPRRRINVSASLSSFLRSGIRVEWDPFTDPYFTNCSSCRTTNNGGLCGFNDSDPSNPFLCFPSSAHLRRHSNRRLLFFAAGFLFLILLSLLAAAVIRRRSIPLNDPTTTFLRLHQIYTYDQLHSSTNGFDPRRKIGDGGFGSVYLAQLPDGRIAAVKRLHRHHATTKSFYNEIQILSSLRHPSLVRLHGYCCDPRGLLLVYDYVPNGTLADHLHGSRSHYRKPSLTWPIRVDVAIQTAAAMDYLHFSLNPPVVHRDITSSNIFMERDMRIKVGDFGLSRLLSLPNNPNSSSNSSECWTGPQGTPGYLDPEYHRSFRLTEKSDVYSFGVVLMELVTGMRAVDPRREKREVALADLVVSKIQVGALHQVVDPVLVRQGEAMGTIEAVAELAFRCVAGDKDDRPDARELVAELKRIRGLIRDAAAAAGKGS